MVKVLHDTKQLGFKSTYQQASKERLNVMYSALDQDYYNGLISNRDLHSKYDYFTTKNTFKIPQTHKASDLLGLQNIVIDLDAVRGASKEDIDAVKKVVSHALINDYNLPISKIVDSGRGLHIYISFEQASYVLEFIYDQLETALVSEYEKALKEIAESYNLIMLLKVDKVNMGASRLIRQEGSINTKSQTLVRAIYSPNKSYDLITLYTEYTEVETAPKALKQAHTSKKVLSVALAEIRASIIEDMSITVGKRNIALFMYYNNLAVFDANAKEKLRELNNSLKYPLKASELNSIIRSVDKVVHYKFTDADFYRLLDIEPKAKRLNANKGRYESTELAKYRVNFIESITITEDTKVNALFMYYNNLAIYDSDAEIKLRQLNQSLDQPLSEQVLEGIIGKVDYLGHYRYKNKTFYNKLDAKPPMTRAQKRAYQTANNKTLNQVRDNKVIALINDTSMTYKEIAKSMDLTEYIVKDIARKYKVKRYKK